MGTLWSVLYFYCNWQLSAKKTTTREWEGMGVILPGVERDFPPVFSWDWDGKRLKFVMHFGNRRWAPGLMRHLAWETRSQRLTFSHYLGSTHILNAFGRIQMSHFNLCPPLIILYCNKFIGLMASFLWLKASITEINTSYTDVSVKFFLIFPTTIAILH